MRPLLAGDGKGVCSGVGEGTIDCSGEIAGEVDSPGVGEEVGVADSCAIATDDKSAISNPRVEVVVMSSEDETSVTV